MESNLATNDTGWLPTSLIYTGGFLNYILPSSSCEGDDGLSLLFIGVIVLDHLVNIIQLIRSNVTLFPAD